MKVKFNTVVEQELELDFPFFYKRNFDNSDDVTIYYVRVDKNLIATVITVYENSKLFEEDHIYSVVQRVWNKEFYPEKFGYNEFSVTTEKDFNEMKESTIKHVSDILNEEIK